MTVKFGRYGIVLYADWGVRRNFGGTTYGPVVFIRAKYINDRGLLEHELVHTRQYLNPKWWFRSRLKWEVAAYKEQLKWYPDDRTYKFAWILSNKYGFGITVEEAVALLRG